jgi:hypothetical protein
LHNWLSQEVGRSLRSASNSAFVPVLEIEGGESRNRTAATNNVPDVRITDSKPSPIRLIAHLRSGVSIELHCMATDTNLVVSTITSLGAR